jgi:molybdate transport system substrate-binding protein
LLSLSTVEAVRVVGTWSILNHKARVSGPHNKEYTMRCRTFITVMILSLAAANGSAQTAPLKVLASNGMKAGIELLRPRLESQVGRRLAIQFDTSAATRQRIESGEAFDVAILTTEVMNELMKSGRVVSGSVVDLGRSGIGFGARAGAGAKPDVRTPEAVKQTLLNAKSLTWVTAGASRVHIERMLEGLGIAADVKPKTVLTQSVDESLAVVTAGKTEMIITLMSEIVPAKGIQFVGPLPPKFQNYVSFSGGAGEKSSAPAASAFLIRLLAEPASARAYESNGMELPIVTDTRPPRLPNK